MVDKILKWTIVIILWLVIFYFAYLFFIAFFASSNMLRVYE